MPELNQNDAVSTSSEEHNSSESDCNFLGFDTIPHSIETHRNQDTSNNKDETEAIDNDSSSLDRNNVDSNLNANSFWISMADQVNQLKNMDKSSNFDSKFISCLLTIVFGTEVLKRSSAGGRASNYNGIVHERLDPQKLEFIRSKKNSKLQTELFNPYIYSCLYSLTEMFLERVAGDDKRAMTFIKYVNKKCNNSRR